MVQNPVDPGTWLIGDKPGLLYNFRQGAPKFSRVGPAIDLSDRVTEMWKGTSPGWNAELGLLTAAFHPKFKQNGEIFIYYTALGPSDAFPLTTRLSRFKSSDGGLTFDRNSEEILFANDQSTKIHQGGTMAFGKDGYLYIAVGNGGLDAAPQNLRELRGKVLRLDVDGGRPYGVPPDNPFVNVPNARPEIFAVGLRNPWRGSINDETGEMWLGDVGDNAYEEINVIRRGGNYGYPIREGAHCRDAPTCRTAGLTDPAYEYRHRGPAAVVGGYFYSGTAFPGLQGRFVFGDAASQQIMVLDSDEAGVLTARTLGSLTREVTSLAKGVDGEIYALSAAKVHRLSPPPGSPQVTLPARLSDTGCVNPLYPTEPALGLIPYQVNMPLWSDGAEKQRWLALPLGGKISVADDGDWDLPVGTVLMKQFRLQGKLVETRLFMRHTDGDWGGYSYEWNDDQNDANLLPGAKVKIVGGQEWQFPSRSQCLQCHTAAAGRSLGLETPQLNGSMVYPKTGRIANQLATLSHLGLFEKTLPGPETLPSFPALVDATAPVDLRARAYLHSNCSMCHRPGGPGQGPQDFRHFVPGVQMNVFNVDPTQGTFGITGAKLFAPGDPDHSMILQRMRKIGLGRMPPLASSIEHRSGTQVIDRWIRSGLGFGVPDTDHDGFADNVDNCPKVANPDQRDTNGNGRGNRCDADLNNDGIVNALDLGIFKKRFGTHDPDADFNGDGIVNALDLGILKSLFGTVSK